MREELSREKMHKAIDASFSGLTGDPWLFQRVSSRAAEGEIKVKKKISAGLVLALVFVLLAAVALAVTLLTSREIAEQVAVPLALENDAESTGDNRVYTPEQLAEIVQVLNENGITFAENSDIMQHLQNGLGYYEDSLFLQICEQGYGNYDFWTPEQQEWYEEMVYRMGHTEAIRSRMPGENNLTREEAEALAVEKLREVYGESLNTEDLSPWHTSLTFYKGTESDPGDDWSYTLRPKDMEHGYYSISFRDSEPHEITGEYSQSLDWNRAYTGDQLISAFEYIYGYQCDWTQEIWQAFHERLQKADESDSLEYTAYKLTGYPEPEAGGISREEAIRIAKDAMELKRAAFDSAVLTEYEGARAWIVTLVIHEPPDDTLDPEAGHYVVSIDGKTGEVQSQRKFVQFEDNSAMFYTPEAVYELTRKGLLRQSDMLPLAVDAFRKEHPLLGDPLDENEYALGSRFMNEPSLEFRTRNPKHGGFYVYFSEDGTVESISVDYEPMTGENLFNRYWVAYGYFSGWDQAKWVQLEEDMQELKPVTIENRLLKATHYPEEDSVRIRHEEAQKLGIQASGLRTAQINTCVLVGAQPHPVWIMQVLAAAPTKVIGIDAETGETVFDMKYDHSFTPNYVLYSLPETWRKMELEMRGAPYVAKAAVIDRYTPQEQSWLDYKYMEDGYNWDLETDGLTVRYTGRWKGMKSYEVEMDENGSILRCEETESPATEEKPDAVLCEQPWIWQNAAAPEGYWERLDEAMKKNEVYFGCLPDRMVVWTEEYGAFSAETWPKDKYAIGYVLCKIRPSEVAAGTVDWPEW